MKIDKVDNNVTQNAIAKSINNIKESSNDKIKGSNSNAGMTTLQNNEEKQKRKKSKDNILEIKNEGKGQEIIK